jgi:hypothetical protein
LIKKLSAVMEPECPSSWSQKPAIQEFPEALPSNLHFHTLAKQTL